MKLLNTIFSILVFALLSGRCALAQGSRPLAENAALRYWSAFSEIQDAGITDPEAKELNAILDGTAPYDDSKYENLLAKNALALRMMARGTSIPNCDWGLDYGLGDDTPVDYARKALVLGRLNVLHAFHLFKADKKDDAIDTLTAGLRFSHDVANGGSLFATVIAKDLLITHLRAIADALKLEELTAAERLRMQGAIKKLGPHGVDWQAAMKREMQVLNRPPWQDSISLVKVTRAYLDAIADPSQMEQLQQSLTTIPLPLREVIPAPQEVIRQKQELDDKLLQIRSILQ